MSSFKWLVTGASSGQGADIALAARHFGGVWLELDVTSDNAQSVVEKAVRNYDVNVIVNNAGYGLRGVMEDLNMQQIRAQMETNLFGALAVTKGAITAFCERRNGTIVMISSASGFSGTPSQSMYSASKFAMEGASESLADELAPFGIRVLIVELGAYCTAFQTAVEKPDEIISEPYKGTTADKVAQRITAGHGRQAGDPVKAAQAIVEVVTGTGRGKDLQGIQRLLLGKDAITRAQARIQSFSADVDRTKEVAEWAVYDEVKYDGYPPLERAHDTRK